MFIELDFTNIDTNATDYINMHHEECALLLPAEYLQADCDAPEPGSWECLFHDCINC